MNPSYEPATLRDPYGDPFGPTTLSVRLPSAPAILSSDGPLCCYRIKFGTGTSTASSNTTSKRIDIGWKHCTAIRENDTNEICCNYCYKIMKGGITRGKHHFIGKSGSVAPCLACPKEVADEIRADENSKKKKQSETFCQFAMQDEESLEEGFIELEARVAGLPPIGAKGKGAGQEGTSQRSSKRCKGGASSTRKGKMVQVEEALEDNSSEEEELEADLSEEEAAGFAPLENAEIDYVGL
ncbi:hypothetical protein JHK87_055178 [Glycine soja]|nr:hypothetical protein JHK87_055178 [Glycine soja]